MRDKTTDPRRMALDALLRLERDKAFANLSLRHLLQEGTLSRVDKALLFRLVYGTVSMRMALDYVLGKHLTRQISSLPDSIRNILRLGAYQIMYLDRIPARAAVDESVKLAHRYGHRGTAGLVNAVLRKIATSVEPAWPPRSEDLAYHLSVRYSHPRFLVERYLRRLGGTATEELLMANNAVPDFCIRTNRLRITPEELQLRLEHEGIATTRGLLAPETLYLDRAPDFTGNLFKSGYFTVQGEASAYVSLMVDPQQGEMVVDLCAAPGGKSTHLAELMGNEGSVVAVDANSKRLALVADNVVRLGTSIVASLHARVENARDHIAAADRVLLDAPCSGFGVLRHKPDIKYHRSEADILSLAAIQRQMIGQAADLVRPGGRLVYSVCTTEPEETNDVVAALLQARMGYTLSREIRLWPHRDGTDGFYVAVLQRKELGVL
ncbi:MAG TPA: 16S rRNA (cytosine(967)-C(5))-methyltransferase RsmB [Bacillota bacterium]|nr:16S rRNA (cytosine(967)-C(5))-methyltransferase RsmB [Bacillota bacterium]